MANHHYTTIKINVVSENSSIFGLLEAGGAPVVSIICATTNFTALPSTGKAGGFLALDWTDELARTSYGLHQELAMTLDADIGYRPVQSLALSATATKRGSSRRRSAKLPDWLDGSVSGGQVEDFRCMLAQM